MIVIEYNLTGSIHNVMSHKDSIHTVIDLQEKNYYQVQDLHFALIHAMIYTFMARQYTTQNKSINMMI